VTDPNDRPSDHPGESVCGKPLFSLRALGRDDPPTEFTLDRRRYTRTHIIKHDFFAATAFYVDDTGTKSVAKFGRAAAWCGVPLAWVGRVLRDREVRFYASLADLANVPALIGNVGDTGFAHAYVEGMPLDKSRPIPDTFFADLQELLRRIHARDMAYVDTNKPQNILLGDDGRPHLIDFQISFDLHGFMGKSFITRWWLKRLQRADIYHILKHKKKLRPDQITPAELEIATKRSFWIKAHRVVFKPYFSIRRAVMKKLRDSGRLLPEGSK